MVASITSTVTPASSSGTASYYPPQNSLEAALDSRQRSESMATVNLQSGDPSGGAQKTCTHDEEAEAMRLRGGCFSLEPCGCNADCCIIPCTIS
ncbi:hypothetical protein JCM3774_000926 [Rhodotorula dairenensis]